LQHTAAATHSRGWNRRREREQESVSLPPSTMPIVGVNRDALFKALGRTYS
jgi:hypothetical protein